MKKILKSFLCSSLIIFILVSCNKEASNENGNSDGKSEVILVEKQIGESGFLISIPSEYSISASDGPDFSVYYFTPTDTTEIDKLSGGLYFGNFPSEFEADNDSCKTEILSGKILGNIHDWSIYNCQDFFSIQTIAENKEGEGWNQRVHAFGHAKSKDELQVILDIFSTLKKK